jgi:hypothetical protein
MARFGCYMRVFIAMIPLPVRIIASARLLGRLSNWPLLIVVGIGLRWVSCHARAHTTANHEGLYSMCKTGVVCLVFLGIVWYLTQLS